MKELIVILLSFMIDVFWAQENRVVKYVEVRKTDFYSTSIINVECNLFDNYFANEITSSTIRDSLTLSMIREIISKMKKDTTGYAPDVRAKLFIHYEDGSIDTLCMSLVGIQLNGISYYGDNKLVDIVNDN